MKMIYNISEKTQGESYMDKFETIIVGAGASGLFAALRLGEAGCRNVLLLERNDRVGRKLSATGNRQGNVTNAAVSEEHYRSSDMRLVRSVLRRFGKDELLRYLNSLGGLFTADEEGRVYPASRQASSVTDILRFRLEKLGVTLRTGEKVTAAGKRGERFFVRTEKGEYNCDALILSCGGKAAPHFGTDGSGYALARSFGHTVTALYPSLVQMKTELSPIRGLKGIRCNCRAELMRGGRMVCGADGDVIFTDYGVSGNAVFQLSPRMREADSISIDFLPGVTEIDLLRALEMKAENDPSLPAEDLFRCIVNSTVGKNILRRCNVDGRAPVSALRKKMPELAYCAKHYGLRLEGSLGFDSAQVTQGGVSASELGEDLMSKKVKNLYITGELVDVDGDCGGYNLQWAFSSGWIAASAVCGRPYENR